MEECEEQAEKRETLRAQQEAERAAAGPKPQIANGVTKYLDIEIPTTDESSGVAKVAKAGDAVDLHYKVLKLGKRSYDGLSGEGTVVFSRGYALEDDEKVPGDHSFKFTLGDGQVIKGESISKLHFPFKHVYHVHVQLLRSESDLDTTQPFETNPSLE